MRPIRLTDIKASRTRRKPVDLASVLATTLALAGVNGFVREHRFHPVRLWRLDLAWPALKLGVECEGLMRNGKGYHQSPDGMSGDCEKHSALAAMGWRLIRVTGRQIRTGHALHWIEAAIAGEVGALFDTVEDPARAVRARRKRRRLAARVR